MSSKSLFSREIDPFVQASVVFGGSIFFILVFKIMHWLGISEYESYIPWTMSAAALLFYGLFNTVLSLSYKNQIKYWFRSIPAYLALMIIGGLVSYLLSGLSINEAMTFRWLYIVFTIGYLAFISIVIFMRKVVLLAQKQDKKLRGEE